MPSYGIRVDLIGQRFGRYLVIDLVGSVSTAPKQRVIVWRCRCDCGNVRDVRSGNLRAGRSRSCGCLSTDVASATKLKHGHSTRRQGTTGIYRVWRAMLQRCTDESCASWPNYGGRGITVCARWRRSFAAFLRDMGGRPKGYTLERIDNERGYSPSNCKWATYREQRMNQRRMYA